MLRRFFMTVCLLLVTAPVFSQDISVEATVSSNQATLKEAVQLTLTVIGAKDEIAPPDLTKLDGFDVQYIGPATQVSIVNGQYSSRHSFNYSLFPTKSGHIQIPGMVLTIGSQNYTTKPIDMEIASSSGVAKSEAESLRDKIFMEFEAPTSDVRIGEKVPLSIKLFVTDVPVRNIQFPTMSKDGFTMDALQQPQQYSQTLNGIKYDVVNFRTFIYPTRSGQILLGPAKIEGSLIYKAPEGNDFFNSFFGNYQARPITITSPSARLNVLALPTEGKPANYSGAVGQLDFNVSISPTEIKTGDPLTLKMKVSGAGNLKSIQMPVFNDDNFKTYEPQLKDEEGAKTIEQVIIPINDKITQAPAIEFSYFDTVTGQYKTITQGPFPLKVIAPAPGQEFKAVGFSELSQNPIHVEQIDYVQKYVKQPIAAAVAFCKTLFFWSIVLVMGLLWGGWFLWQRHMKRLAQDSAFARRINALKNAKQGLLLAEKTLKIGNPKEFYGILHRTLSDYFRDKALKEESIAGLKEIYDACDLVRFAGGNADQARMKEHLDQARRIILAPAK